jgi:hypothetical protein
MLMEVTPAAGAVRPPRQDIEASPHYMHACVEYGAMSHRCIARSVAAIDSARAREHMRHPQLILPANYRSLTAAEQVFVVIDLERVDRGLRPLAGMTPRLSRDASQAAFAGVDPTPARSQLRRSRVRVYRTLYARDFGALAADYEWMYNDGYATDGGSTTNTSCSYPGAAGCGGHRSAILCRFRGLPRLIGGMGSASESDGAVTATAILTGGRGRSPHFTYTWRDALRHGADGRG